MNLHFVGSLTCAALIALTAVGCNETKTFTGKVTMDGAPLANAGVQFHAKDSAAPSVHYSTTDAAGSYAIIEDGANPVVPGDYVVVVEKVPTEMGGKSEVAELYRDKAKTPLTITVSADSTTLPPLDLSSDP